MAPSKTPQRVMVVDDDPHVLQFVAAHLQGLYATTTESDPRRALECLERESFDLVLTDQVMPELTGLELMQQTHRFSPDLPFVFLTALGDLQTAVEILKAGAADYLQKPVSRETLLHRLGMLLERNRLDHELRQLRLDVARLRSREQMLGQSPPMLTLLERVAAASPTPAHVLILGETGTGKEIVARMIHENSRAAAGPFVAINCGALPEGLLDSELFGHARGAFTGATQARCGLIEESSGGTLFLDEIGDIGPSLQAKLLRVLQESEVRRVGESRSFKIDTRFIAATHRDLKAMVVAGSFRQDLLYRLDVITLRLPPLRDRREDIPLLLQHFLSRAASRHKRTVTAFSREALARAMSYPFPGNVRELENCVERAVIFCRSSEISAEDLFGDVPAPNSAENPAPVSLEDVERLHVLRILERCDGSTATACRLLGISQRTLQHKLNSYRKAAAAPAR